MALCSAIFLGFACFAIVNPVIPVVILEMGGDAFLVGLLVATYSIPSILLRPFMGRLVDEWSRWRVLLLGAAGLGLSSFLYLLPGLGAMAHGAAAQRVLIRGAQHERHRLDGHVGTAGTTGRGGGHLNLMPSLAYMIAPAAGLLLLGAVGAGAAFVVAGVLGVSGAAVIGMGPLRKTVQQVAPPARAGGWRTLLERRAVLPMSLEFLWVTTNVLFFVFPPVWAAAREIPVAELALYYPIVGGVLVLSRVIIGRRLDRWSRGAALLAGAAGGTAAIMLASFAETVLVLTVAGAIYAASSSLVSPTAAAVAIDRADPARRGTTMATYSMGFPLGNGFGALLWGVVIAALGFPAPFLVALLTMATMAALVWWSREQLMPGRL